MEPYGGNLMSVFSRTKSGRCFIKSNILLAPTIEVSETGFLIMEHKEALDVLPQWTKTPYYCINDTLKPCQTTKIPTGKQYGRSFREYFTYVRNSIITDRKAHCKKIFKNP